MKIWFQNRRVKYKKEDGSVGSNHGIHSPIGQKCCCLRGCQSSGKRKSTEDEERLVLEDNASSDIDVANDKESDSYQNSFHACLKL